MPSKASLILALALSVPSSGQHEDATCDFGPAHKFNSRLECCENLDGYDKAAFLASNNCTNSTDTDTGAAAALVALDDYRSLPATCGVAIVVKENPVSWHAPDGWQGSMRYNNHCLKITATGRVNSVGMDGLNSYIELQGHQTGEFQVKKDYGTVVFGATYTSTIHHPSRRVIISADHASIITESGAAWPWVYVYAVDDTKCNGHVLGNAPYHYCGYCAPHGWHPASRPAGNANSGC